MSTDKEICRKKSEMVVRNFFKIFCEIDDYMIMAKLTKVHIVL